MKEAVADMPVEEFELSYQPQSFSAARVIGTLDGDTVEEFEGDLGLEPSDVPFQVEDITPLSP